MRHAIFRTRRMLGLGEALLLHRPSPVHDPACWPHSPHSFGHLAVDVEYGCGRSLRAISSNSYLAGRPCFHLATASPGCKGCGYSYKVRVPTQAWFQYALRQTNTDDKLSDAASLNTISLGQISGILGSSIKAVDGRRLFKILHRQRLSGTLDEEAALANFDDATIARALQWLRKNYPVDEDAAILRRVDHEERQMQDKFAQEVRRLEAWTPEDRAKDAADRYAMAEEVREAAKQQRKSEAQQAATSVSITNILPQQALVDRSQRTANWREKHLKRASAFIPNDFTPERLSTRDRLLPSATFVLAFLGLCALFAGYYKVPEEALRLFPGISGSTATLLLITSVNILIWLAWSYPPLWKPLVRYFMVTIVMPKPMSLLGNVFSHQLFTHLLTNLAFLWAVGPNRKSGISILLPF